LSDGNKRRVLDWKTAVQIPWGVGIIIGGGYAMAESFKVTGLAEWIGLQLSFFSDYPTLIVLIVVIAFILVFTELNPNTATANIFLPVLGAMAVAGNINPLLLMIPATFASSLVFIMPAGTGPNTVIFGSNRVTAGDMARCGLGLKILSLILLSLLAYFLIIPLMGIDRVMPVWAGQP
jgi:sodium-dependent dicarboxylate transporter 2/3/5